MSKRFYQTGEEKVETCLVVVLDEALLGSATHVVEVEHGETPSWLPVERFYSRGCGKADLATIVW